MKDLLNEDDFLADKFYSKNWFRYFYLICGTLSTLLFFMVRFYREYFNKFTANLTIIFTFLIPLIASMIMIFAKKDNILKLKPKKAAGSVLYLFLSCYASLLLIGLFVILKSRPFHLTKTTFLINTLLILLLGYGILYLIAIAIIIPVLKRAQKINRLPK